MGTSEKTGEEPSEQPGIEQPVSEQREVPLGPRRVRIAGFARLGTPREWVAHPLVWFGILCLWFCVRYVTQEPTTAYTASFSVHGDGTYYYLYLRSALFDRDFDFTNDLALVGQPFSLGISKITGRPKNFWTCGTAIFWAPFAAYARLQLAVTNALGVTNEVPNGAGPVFQRIALFGSLAWGLVAAWVTLAFSRKAFGWSNAFFAVLAVCFATPLSWYMLRQPSFSHAVSAAAVALFVWVWYAGQGKRTWLGWAGLGGLLGLAMLVRPQDAIHTVLPFYEWLILAVAAGRMRDRRQLAELVAKGFVFALSATAVYGLQILAWKAIYGRWYLDAHDSTFLDFRTSRFLEVLYSSRAGLFAWHPITYVAVFGLVGAAISRRLAPDFRRFARLALVIIALQALINGATVDWWGGWSFGGRRFLGCSLYFGFGLAAALAGLIALIQRHSTFFLKVALPALLLSVPIALNGQMFDDYASGRITPAIPQDMLSVWTGATSRLMSSAYDVTGNLGSAPLNWWLAANADVSPSRYDRLSPVEMFYDRRTPAVLSLSDDRFALGGFGPKATVEAQAANWVTGQHSTWGFALRKAEALVGDVTVFVPRVPSRIRISLGGRQVGTHDLRAVGWATVHFDVPRGALRSGINVAHVEQQIPSPALPVVANTLSGLAWGTLTLTPKVP